MNLFGIEATTYAALRGELASPRRLVLGKGQRRSRRRKNKPLTLAQKIHAYYARVLAR